MATTKPKDDNKLLWIAGTAAITAFVVYFVNKEMRTREDVKRMQMMEELKALKGEVLT